MINPIKLANEWRDSLFVTAATAAAFAFAPSPMQALDVTSLAIFWRELTRAQVWRFNPPKQIIGGSRVPQSLDVDAGATIVSGVIGVIRLALWSPFSSVVTAALVSLYGLLLLLLVVVFLSFRSRTPRDCLAALTEAWDWPRKRDGGGETQKLKDLFSSALARPVMGGAR